MHKLITLVSVLLITTTNYAQDSQPSLSFGNGIQGSGGLENGYVNAIQALEKVQERADVHYKAERYERAYKLYHELAQYNDKFSQYRIAYMHANGRGVDKDILKAYAWSFVASETRQKGIVNYHVKVRDQLTPQQLERAKEMATEYRETYGTFAIASGARKLVRKEKRACTGSRIGTSCDRVSSSGISCSAVGDQTPSRDCLLLGSVGLPSVTGMMPKDLRQVENSLDDIMDLHNPGRVELRDLEIIED